MFELRMECLRLASQLVGPRSGQPEDVVRIAEMYMAWINTDARFQQSQIRVQPSDFMG